MLLFLDACTDSGFLSIIYFVKQMIKIVFLILPIILIVMISVDFFKNVIAKGSDDMKKNTNVAIKRIVYCVFAFFIPTIVNVVMNSIYILMSDNETKENNLLCWKNANVDSIQMYKQLENSVKTASEEAKKQAYLDKYNQNQQNIDNDKTSGGLGSKTEQSSNNIDGNGNDPTKFESTKDNYTIYVGDSRTHTMCINAGVWDSNERPTNNNEDCITGPGKNIVWYKKEALPEMEKIILSHPNANIVINMGGNDISPIISSTASTDSAVNYANLHKELAMNYPEIKVVIVSMTPFDEEKKGAIQYKLTNDLVEKFNNTMKENISGSRIVYCDVTSKLEGKFSTYDGLHHGAQVNKMIYEEIRKCL